MWRCVCICVSVYVRWLARSMAFAYTDLKCKLSRVWLAYVGESIRFEAGERGACVQCSLCRFWRVVINIHLLYVFRLNFWYFVNARMKHWKRNKFYDYHELGKFEIVRVRRKWVISQCWVALCVHVESMSLLEKKCTIHIVSNGWFSLITTIIETILLLLLICYFLKMSN